MTPDSHSPKRDLHGIASKVLILGLDGATFDVLMPLMDAGRMPNLARLIKGGASGVLRSTIPPITPAAWTTFMTGRTPGAHGIIDFERYDVRTGSIAFNTTSALHGVRTIWQTLGDRGLRVGCVNVPMTFPPVPVNGFLISGFEAVSTANEFTYPASLKSDILTRWPDYTFKNRWRRKTFSGDALFAENLADITRSFDQGADVLEHCGDTFGWDVLMIVFKMVDNLQHKAWRYLDPRTRDRWPRRRAMVEDCFAHLDGVIGRIMRYADKHDASIFMMSDHGHGSLEGKAQPNRMLLDWGFLNLRQGGAQSGNRLRHAISKLFRKKGKFAAGALGIGDDLAVDFSRTKAAIMHAGMAGFLYVNLKGRQPTGIVAPEEYESLRCELKQRFESVTCRDPQGQTIPVFEAVHKPEELYGISRDENESLPDLILSPTPRLSVIRKIRGRGHVKWIPLKRMEGTHRREGVYAVSGPGVIPGCVHDTDIINAAPTILAMLGIHVPAEMEGKVIEEIFDPPLIYDRALPETGGRQTDRPTTQPAYSEEDMAKLTARLADLGYLE